MYREIYTFFQLLQNFSPFYYLPWSLDATVPFSSLHFLKGTYYNLQSIFQSCFTALLLMKSKRKQLGNRNKTIFTRIGERYSLETTSKRFGWCENIRSDGSHSYLKSKYSRKQKTNDIFEFSNLFMSPILLYVYHHHRKCVIWSVLKKWGYVSENIVSRLP